MERIARLAREIAPLVGADPDLAERAAILAKADLVTEMVGEFPELQGLMGRYYAEAQGEEPSVARAIEEHYKPQGPSDGVPSDPVSVAVALADKLDTLVGFWAIDEKPTGSKDPYALRRAALGIIRLLLERALSVRLNQLFKLAYLSHVDVSEQTFGAEAVWEYEDQESSMIYVAKKDEERFWSADYPAGVFVGKTYDYATSRPLEPFQFVRQLLVDFFADRLKVYLREQGQRHDLIDAVFALGDQDDLLLIVRRVEALDAFLKTDDGANLLAGVKRATNILRIEEKKDGRSFDGAPDPALFAQDEERVLADAIAPCGGGGGEGPRRRGLRRRDDGARRASRAGRRLLRRRDRQRRRPGPAREPPAPPRPHPRGDGEGRGLLEDRGLSRADRPSSEGSGLSGSTRPARRHIPGPGRIRPCRRGAR